MLKKRQNLSLPSFMNSRHGSSSIKPSLQLIGSTRQKPSLPTLQLFNVVSSDVCPYLSVRQEHTSEIECKPSRITDNIYLGTYRHGEDAVQLGMSYVINCISSNPYGDYFKSQNIKYLDLPMLDTSSYDISQHFCETKAFIDEAIANNAKILVHCHAGISRSATIVIAYLMATYPYFNGSLDNALRFVQSKRDVIEPNLGFYITLQNFELIAQDQLKEAVNIDMDKSLRLHKTELRLFSGFYQETDLRTQEIAVVPYRPKV